MVTVLRLCPAGVKVDEASRHFFDESDVGVQPSSPPFEKHPVPALTKAGPSSTASPEPASWVLHRVPHAYAQHVDNSVDNS